MWNTSSLWQHEVNLSKNNFCVTYEFMQYVSLEVWPKLEQGILCPDVFSYSSYAAEKVLI